MTTLFGKISVLLGGLTLLLAAYLGGVVDSRDVVLGGAANGLPATISTSTALIVGPQSATTIWSSLGSNGNCAARVITTVENPINISFGDRANYPAGNRATSTAKATATYGHFQATSTTVVYDASIYGCGTVSAYGFNASSTVTVSEFN